MGCGAPPYIPPHPSLPFAACLQHMSPPLDSMATAPHVADRRMKMRGRGGEKETEGKEGWMRRKEEKR